MQQMIKQTIHPWSIFARDTATEKQWIQEITSHQRVMGKAIGDEVFSAHDKVQGMILIDQQADD